MACCVYGNGHSACTKGGEIVDLAERLLGARTEREVCGVSSVRRTGSWTDSRQHVVGLHGIV